jgi:hypothetical protein
MTRTSCPRFAASTRWPSTTARAELLALVDGTDDGDRTASIIDAHAHAVLFAMNVTHHFGFQQWVIFDDLWGAAHPDLARSLVRYGTTWDAVADPKKARTPPTKEQVEQRAWKSALRGRTDSRPYAASGTFLADEVIDHAKFGIGIVSAAADKIEVQFRDAHRILVHKRA